MKTVFMSLALLLLVSANAQEKKKFTVHSEAEIIITMKKEAISLTLNDVLNSLSSTEQLFTIDAGKDTILKGSKGTILCYKANSLEFEDGSQITGLVSIYLKESMELTEMIGDKHSTVSGDELLETRGMIQLNAKVNGKKVVLKKSEDLVVMVPNSLGNGEMNLFDGQTTPTGTINWNLTQSPVSRFSPSAFWDCGKIITYKGSNVPPCRMMCKLRKWLGMKPSKRRQAKTFTSTRSYYERGLQHCPELDSIIKKYKIRNQAQLMRLVYAPLMKKYNARSLEDLRKKMSDAQRKNVEVKIGNKNVSFNDLNYYVYSAKQLSWANLDQFMKLPENTVVALGTNRKQDTQTSVSLVFRNRTLVVAAYIDENGMYHYPKLPKNETGTLVAIRVVSGKPLLAIKEVVFEEGIAELEFSEVSLEELKAKISAVNM